jgi:hypothetical protein
LRRAYHRNRLCRGHGASRRAAKAPRSRVGGATGLPNAKIPRKGLTGAWEGPESFSGATSGPFTPSPRAYALNQAPGSKSSIIQRTYPLVSAPTPPPPPARARFRGYSEPIKAPSLEPRLRLSFVVKAEHEKKLAAWSAPIGQCWRVPSSWPACKLSAVDTDRFYCQKAARQLAAAHPRAGVLSACREQRTYRVSRSNSPRRHAAFAPPLLHDGPPLDPEPPPHNTPPLETFQYGAPARRHRRRALAPPHRSSAAPASRAPRGNRHRRTPTAPRRPAAPAHPPARARHAQLSSVRL